ncbi:hypothetical protein D3C75_1101530 [compost metagenome]
MAALLPLPMLKLRLLRATIMAAGIGTCKLTLPSCNWFSFWVLKGCPLSISCSSVSVPIRAGEMSRSSTRLPSVTTQSEGKVKVKPDCCCQLLNVNPVVCPISPTLSVEASD